MSGHDAGLVKSTTDFSLKAACAFRLAGKLASVLNSTPSSRRAATWVP